MHPASAILLRARTSADRARKSRPVQARRRWRNVLRLMPAYWRAEGWLCWWRMEEAHDLEREARRALADCQN